MKITCNRAALHEAVQLASSIVPARTPKPILQCAKLQANQDDKTLNVLATDGDISIEFRISQVEVVSAGATVVPADRLAAILHESTDDTLSLEVTDASCVILGKDSRFVIHGQAAEDFPAFPAPEQGERMKIKASLLKRLIHMTVFAAARENTRYAINGVLWEQEGKKLRLVATDGRRLAMISGQLTAATKEDGGAAVVPIKTMGVLERILSDPDEQIEVGFHHNQIVVGSARVQLTGNLGQGRFPKYADVLPTGCNKKAQISTEALRSAVRRAALLTNENSRGVALAFGAERLRISSSTPEAGDAEVNMDIKYEGEELTIGFNPQYILEALRVIDEPEIVFEFVEAAKPGIIKAGRDFLYVLMPVTV